MIHIKNLAEQTKITVRTLRYYEQIGLLVSSSKTEGGHRLYTEGDLQKLQQIQFYKNMGYRLSDIKEMLTDPEWNWSDGLANQLTFILEEQSRLNEMEQTLRALVSGIAVEEGNQEKAMQHLIKLSLQDKRGLDQYRKSTFTDAELGLWAKLPKMSVGNPESMEWIALVGLLTKYYTCKEPLSSPCVQNVIRRMLEKQEVEYGGQDAFIDKLWEMRKNPSASEQLGLYPIKSGVLEYMDQAYGIFISSVEQTSNEEGGRT